MSSKVRSCPLGWAAAVNTSDLQNLITMSMSIVVDIQITLQAPIMSNRMKRRRQIITVTKRRRHPPVSSTSEK